MQCVRRRVQTNRTVFNAGGPSPANRFGHASFDVDGCDGRLESRSKVRSEGDRVRLPECDDLIAAPRLLERVKQLCNATHAERERSLLCVRQLDAQIALDASALICVYSNSAN
jgi:hypothetical protein